MQKTEKQPHFGKRGKTTEENAHCIVCVIHSYLLFTTDPTRKDLASRAKELDKYLARAKGILEETDPYYKYPLTGEQVKGLLEGISTGPYLKEIILNLHKVEFEKRKELVQLFNNFLKLEAPGSNPLVNYILGFHGLYIDYVFANYSVKDMTFCAGSLLRAFLEKEELHKTLLNLVYIEKLVGLITDATFDVASDAIDSFTGILTHKRTPEDTLAREFVRNNYGPLLEILLKMVNHQNFFAKREALKLLNTLLRDPYLNDVMQLFVSSVANLKLIMTLLLDQTKAVQFEAFRLMQLIVKEHTKYPPITQILKKNQEHLIEFFMVFQNEREEMDFQKDKKILVSQLKAIN